MSLGLARPAELPVCGEPAGAQIDVGGYGGVSAACAVAARAGGNLRACAAWLRREPGCSALTFRANDDGVVAGNHNLTVRIGAFLVEANGNRYPTEGYLPFN